ncbi:mechanosensitive ion channel domain-containing protein [Thiohalocapsa marina]|nr:mechanosensitive ion channel domain-containing protein [Thiohalocapsa marina]
MATLAAHPAVVEARMAEAEAATDLAEEERERLLGQYRRVLDNLAAQAAAQDEAARLQERQARAPGQAESIRARLSAMEPLPQPPVELPADADLAAVRRLLVQEAAEVATRQERLDALQQALAEEADALPGWFRGLAELRQRALDLEDELAGALAAGAEGAEALTRYWLLESERDRLRAEALVLEQKLLGADVRRALTLAQRDEARLSLDRALARQAWLQAQEEQRRRAEADRVLAEIEAAKEAAADAHPQVWALVRANAAVAETINQIKARAAAAEAASAETATTSRALQQAFDNDRRRIAAAGISRAMGRALVDRRERLPSVRELRQQAAERADAEAEATLAQLQWREELLQLGPGAAGQFGAELAQLDPVTAEALEAQLDEQIRRRVDLLEGAIEAEERHLRALAELDLAAESLRTVILDYRAFLDERLLWTRSHVPVTEQGFDALPRVIAELVSPSNWLLVAQALAAGLAAAWSWWVGLLVVALLLVFDRWLRQRIRATAAPLRRISKDRFAYTLGAILLTLLLAAPVSLLLALLGLILISAPSPEAFPYAVGNGLLRIAPPLFCLRAFRMLCMSGGVAERHFRWRTLVLRRLRRSLDIAIWTLLPLAFVAAVMSTLGELQAATLGRLALTGVTLGFALLVAVALHPRHGLLRDLLAETPNGLANRLRHLWYPLAVAVPLMLSILTLAGFHYTAVTLFDLWLGQLWLLFGLVVLQQSIVRWLLVTRRELALRVALERRARREAQRQDEAMAEAEANTETSAEARARTDAGETDEETVDLVALDVQTRRLVNALIALGAGVGLWVLWADVLPALNVLERIPLWGNSGVGEGGEDLLPVTVADLGVMLLIVAVTVIAVRNLPALLEILLLKNTGIGAGGRYTIIALTGYAVMAVATLSVAGRLGLSWQQVQWLVAALGVGIGFGLQEIVANFISGLIILFERPIRVGDTVSVGENTGVVARIEIRATTIRTLDQRELLVPNKQLITSEVINWTLSDQINRADILVSIEYGSDTETALRILGEVAAADPRVMTDPAPVITVENLGERGLELMLRVFLPTIADRLRIRGDLVNAIDRRLREAGIPIGLPRRDVRMRDAPLT